MEKVRAHRHYQYEPHISDIVTNSKKNSIAYVGFTIFTFFGFCNYYFFKQFKNYPCQKRVLYTGYWKV